MTFEEKSGGGSPKSVVVILREPRRSSCAGWWVSSPVHHRWHLHRVRWKPTKFSCRASPSLEFYRWMQKEFMSNPPILEDISSWTGTVNWAADVIGYDILRAELPTWLKNTISQIPFKLPVNLHHFLSLFSLCVFCCLSWDGIKWQQAEVAMIHPCRNIWIKVADEMAGGTKTFWTEACQVLTQAREVTLSLRYHEATTVWIITWDTWKRLVVYPSVIEEKLNVKPAALMSDLCCTSDRILTTLRFGWQRDPRSQTPVGYLNTPVETSCGRDLLEVWTETTGENER